MLWQRYHKILIPYTQWLYNVPNGRVGKIFTRDIVIICEDVLKQKYNMERLMVFFPVMLQQVEGVKGLPDVRKQISARLARLAEWREGKFKGLVEDTLQSLQAAQCKS